MSAAALLGRLRTPRVETIRSSWYELRAVRREPPYSGLAEPAARAGDDDKREIVVDNGLTDIVEQRLDAGVRLGEQVARDMVAVRISPDVRMAVVGTPGYFATHPKPKTPRDLTAHNCINIRLPTAGGIYAWEFRKGERELNVRVEGQLVFNSATMATKAALAGVGLAYVPEQRVLSQLESGQLLRVLSDWCTPFPGFHLYYPSRRQPTPAFVVVANALRRGI